ncbi:MAG: hypothetical protein JWP08_2423, partial [Bryobacterales bacterium]|nr:hypothetical protein [Bryobacterales bacterium]
APILRFECTQQWDQDADVFGNRLGRMRSDIQALPLQYAANVCRADSAADAVRFRTDSMRARVTRLALGGNGASASRAHIQGSSTAGQSASIAGK